jgi:hypothetical protein
MDTFFQDLLFHAQFFPNHQLLLISKIQSVLKFINFHWFLSAKKISFNKPVQFLHWDKHQNSTLFYVFLQVLKIVRVILQSIIQSSWKLPPNSVYLLWIHHHWPHIR